MSIVRSRETRSKHNVRSKHDVRSRERSKRNTRSKFLMVAAGLLLCVLVSCGEGKYKVNGVVDYVGTKGTYITDSRGEKWMVDVTGVSEGDEVTLTLDTMRNGNVNDDRVLSVSEIGPSESVSE